MVLCGHQFLVISSLGTVFRQVTDYIAEPKLNRWAVVLATVEHQIWSLEESGGFRPLLRLVNPKFV
jgi:hypothetical protein